MYREQHMEHSAYYSTGPSLTNSITGAQLSTALLLLCEAVMSTFTGSIPKYQEVKAPLELLVQ